MIALHGEVGATGARVKTETLLIAILLVLTTGISSVSANDEGGKRDFEADCARCHGPDGKGTGSVKRVTGYVSVDLTKLAVNNGGQFPRERVHDSIDGRKKVAAHFSGDMPRWGAKFAAHEQDPVQRRISALVDYIESIQQK